MTWRRVILAVGLVAVAMALTAQPAGAHPLGNFTSNSYAGLRVGIDEVAVDYVLDLAEIPAQQARPSIDRDGDGDIGPREAARYETARCAELAGGLRLLVDGKPVALGARGGILSFPPGVAGLTTLRLECDLRAPLPAIEEIRELRFADGNLDGRIGWREVTILGDGTTVVEADVPSSSVSARLTAYPADGSRLDVRSASVMLRPGGPRAAEVVDAASGSPEQSVPGSDRATRVLGSLVAERNLSVGFGLLALGAALALGAFHALAPGHGKSVMAAYVVGRRGSLSHALGIGVSVAVTHTAGVFTLGTLLYVSDVIAPERLYPVLGAASGLLVAAVGGSLLVRALRHRRDSHHGHDHPHVHEQGHAHDHGHAHHHHDAEERTLGWGGILAMGFAGGMVPSPSAVVVLLGALAIGRVWFGLLLVIGYGLGMAVTLVAAGLLLVRARGWFEPRLTGATRGAVALRALPAISSAIVLAGGLLLTARAVAGA